MQWFMWGQRSCNSLKDNSLEGCFLNWGSEVVVMVADRGWIRGGSFLVQDMSYEGMLGVC